jgi:phage FluMu gp28-like protein
MKHYRKYFLPYQIAWLHDASPLKLMEKSRQIGASWTDAHESVMKAGVRGARLDVWISSRDEAQARLYLDDCRKWAKLLHLAAKDLGQFMLSGPNGGSAYVLEFASGPRIYSLSSNPNALAGKRGHVKLDEFALHHDQRLLYRVAKPVTTWGGTLAIISTHRGENTLFNELVRSVKEGGNPMGWSLHSMPVHEAVAQGLVERINRKTGGRESREEFLKRLRAQCIDEEQWLQEYCCVPASEKAAFLSYDLITGCEDPELHLLSAGEVLSRYSGPVPVPQGSTAHQSRHPSIHQSLLYLGVDVARKKDLCVLDLGEKLDEILWDRLRLELQDRPFAEIKSELYRLLRLPGLRRCCIDATGLGMQLAEEAKREFGWKVEPITFTASAKEQLAFGLKRDLENARLRLAPDQRLRADLHSLRKEVSLNGNLRFVGDTEDSHCDRTWALALRQHAARRLDGVWAAVG